MAPGIRVGPSTVAWETRKNNPPSSSSCHLATVLSQGVGHGEHRHKGWATASSVPKGFPAAKHACVVYRCVVYTCVHMYVEMCLSVCVRPWKGQRLVLIVLIRQWTRNSPFQPGCLGSPRDMLVSVPPSLGFQTHDGPGTLNPGLQACTATALLTESSSPQLLLQTFCHNVIHSPYGFFAKPKGLYYRYKCLYNIETLIFYITSYFQNEKTTSKYILSRNKTHGNIWQKTKKQTNL